MNDPIKKFVRENREAFDHLEPSADVLQRLKAQLKPAPVLAKRLDRWGYGNRWLAAAVLLLGLVTVYIWWSSTNRRFLDKGERLAKQSVRSINDSAYQPTTPKPVGDTLPNRIKAEPKQLAIRKKSRPQRRRTLPETEQDAALPQSVYAKLADSTSASNRLAAILTIQHTGYMNSEIQKILSETMNHDGNSNVRIAALELLGKHAEEPHIADMFVSSLATQKDPLVQLGLINILSQMDNSKIDKTLFTLANDPQTFAAVKDEAYAVLLSQNKL